jgi:Protein of unknown function (DUF1570)
MSHTSEQPDTALPGFGRRAWLLQAISGAAVLAAIAQPLIPGSTVQEQEEKKNPPDEAAQELERATARVRAVTSRAPQRASSDQYQAVGDASESFMKIAIGDCESIAQEFLEHYQAKGFRVKRAARRMTVVAFRDERPFFEFARKFALPLPPNVCGFYSRADNWLVLYDSRNVPAIELGGALKNVRNLAHEATHQLTFSTGLLNPNGDVPTAIVEGLACYSETRRLRGRNEPGLLNNERLDELAHVQRRTQWINAADLLVHDSPARGANSDQMQLFYAESWILIHTLMNSPDRLPEFQAYLKTIFPRVDKKNRLADAAKCFGDLDRLDQELRREAIRLQKEPRP